MYHVQDVALGNMEPFRIFSISEKNVTLKVNRFSCKS